jgi:Domain of unknown function (DUF5134)
MIGPTWLAAVFGCIALGVAFYTAARLIVAWRTAKATDYEVDASHVVMGVAMTGMLIPASGIVAPGTSSIVWACVFMLISAWFAISVIREALHSAGAARFMGHHLPHLVMSLAMVYMLLVSATPVHPGAMDASMGSDSSGPAIALPTLDLLFALFLVGYAVLVIDRLPLIAMIGTGDLRVPFRARKAGETLVPLAPRLAAVSYVAMAITMGYMLTMMLA